MPLDCIILDFDGTFTDVYKEAAPFVPAYRAELSKALGRDIEQGWKEAEEEVRKKPNEYGWKNNGRIVAPALADPYILCTVVAQILFDRFSPKTTAEERGAIVQGIYQRSYGLTSTHFRKNAKEVLDELLAKFPG